MSCAVEVHGSQKTTSYMSCAVEVHGSQKTTTSYMFQFLENPENSSLITVNRVNLQE